MVEEELRNMDIGLPISYILFCGNVLNKGKLGFGYEDANVCQTISNVEIRLLDMPQKRN